MIPPPVCATDRRGQSVRYQIPFQNWYLIPLSLCCLWQTKTGEGMRRVLVLLGVVFVLAISGPIEGVHAQDNLMGGIGDIVSGALSLPAGVLAGTLNGPPVIGTISGAVFGALNTVSLTTRGVLRLVGVAIPLAASLAPLLPVFL